MFTRTLLIALCSLFAALPQLAGQGTQLLRQPAISPQAIAFAYANDIWLAGRGGGDARRLTTFPGQESLPHFSPDGRFIAFSGEYDGNVDVFIVPVAGGEPQRLTWHPSGDWVTGWSSDGSKVLFRSGRTGAPIAITKFWSVDVEGGLPQPLPIPRVWNGEFSKDGQTFAYQPFQRWDAEWRNYRGGQAGPIWLLNMDDSSVVKVPWEGSQDTDPVWIGDDVYFLSDRNYTTNVYRYRPSTKEVTQLTEYTTFDVKNLSAGGSLLIYEYGGYLHAFNPANNKTLQLKVNVRGDQPWARPHWESVGDQLSHPALSPSGKRALFEARGEIFTVPAEKGDARNLTRSSGVADRAPAWSPDGQWISWFSDESGEYELVIAPQSGQGQTKRWPLQNPTFYFTPAWSPDSNYILYTDEGLNLSYIDIRTGEQTFVDTDSFAHPQRTVNPVWSPDSRFIAYAKRLNSQYHAIMVYGLEDSTVHQVTDALSDAVSPAWDASGKYLYFLASTNFALATGWLDMSSLERPLRREIYFAVLSKDDSSPLLPTSDEEETSDDPAEEETEASDEVVVKIDFDDIQQRILALPVPSRSYTRLTAGSAGNVFYAETIENQPGSTLHRFSLEDQEASVALEGVLNYVVSFDGSKLLYQSGDTWGIADANSAVEAGSGAINTALQMKVDPRAEWRQMFREAWRYQRDFFYVENLHGADWDWVYETYSPWVEHVGHRSDLTYLLDILGGETSVGHSFTGGGDLPDVASVGIGLLGADLVQDGEHYRIATIYSGENWNPELRAPLSAPGIDIEEGDWLLAVDGIELSAPTNPYALFEQTAGQQVVLTVASGKLTETENNRRQVTVVPVDSETALRRRHWIESNRRTVDELSGGRLAYVWLPNTSVEGYTEFNRYYFAQQDKLGAVIDERFNGGGFAADYIVDLLSRRLQGFFNNPVGDKRPFTNPGAGIWGPKVMIINESAGSGGDLMPWMFRNMEIGPLVGTRTWGGLVGIWDVPPLIDGGFITAPRGGFYTNEGEWAVENEGVAPDVHVEMTPARVMAGEDPQLLKAIEVALAKLEEGGHPVIVPQPADPVRSRRAQ